MTLEKDKSILAQQERTCEECGRKFVIPRMDLWAYKIISKGHTLWFCRYNCARAAERKLDAKKVGRKKEMKSKKPSREVLEKDLEAGMPIANIAKKNDASSQSVKVWIKSYGLSYLEGIKPKKETSESKPLSGRSRAPMTSGVAATTQEEPPVIQHSSPVDDMVQPSPTMAEIEQFHTDDPVQELPKVEMDQSINIPAATKEEISEMYAKTEYFEDQKGDVTDSLSGEEFDRIMSTVEVQLVEPSGMTEEENMTDAAWEAKDQAHQEAPFEEVWLGIRDDILSQKRVYVAEAEKAFNDRLRGLFLEVMG